MRVLLLGSGGREHALARAIALSPSLSELHAAPGSPGIGRLATCHPVAADDGEAVLGLARSLEIDLVVVGPEGPLVAGVADVLRHSGIAVYGPSAAAARIEGSKTFAKEVMAAAGVPTARLLDAPSAPCVLKADGLAAGKGVVVCHDESEVVAGLAELAAFGDDLVVEELLAGPEVSLFAICDGAEAVVLPLAQDFKRAYDGDDGPNTGGMGSLAPVPGLDADDGERLAELTVKPVLAELAARGCPFVGTLFVGLMLTADGPRVLEYNCRFGDPETQSVLPLLEGDLLALLAGAAQGRVERDAVRPRGDTAAVTVVVAAGTYPAAGDRGTHIDGVEAVEAGGVLVYHAGTALHDGQLVTNGGRLVCVTGLGTDVVDARRRAYAGVQQLRIAGARWRSDIAAHTDDGPLRPAP